jgi:hypothetical protein
MSVVASNRFRADDEKTVLSCTLPGQAHMNTYTTVCSTAKHSRRRVLLGGPFSLEASFIKGNGRNLTPAACIAGTKWTAGRAQRLGGMI